MNSLILSQLYSRLPLYAEEGGECTVVSITDLLAEIDQCSTEAVKICVYLIQRLFTTLGILDRGLLASGQWRFMSYPAALLGRSVLECLKDDQQSLFESGFWLPQDSASPNSDKQRALLHALESQRKSHHSCAANPIRYIHVAWGLIVVDGKILLRHREDSKRQHVGNYVLVGGRLSQNDLRKAGEDNALSILQSSAASDNKKAIEIALMREIQEETGLDKVDTTSGYTYTHWLSINPYTAVEGAGANHALTEYRIHLYTLKLSRGALFQLYDRVNRDSHLCWATLKELGAGQSHDGKMIFLDALYHHFGSKDAWAKAANELPVSFQSNYTFTSESDGVTLPYRNTLFERGRTGKERIFDIPVSQEEIKALVALKLIADGFEPEVLPDGVEMLGSGWIRVQSTKLNGLLKKLAVTLAAHQLPILMCIYEDYFYLDIAPCCLFLADEYMTWSLHERTLTITRSPITTPLGEFISQTKTIGLSTKLASELTYYATKNSKRTYQIEEFQRVIRRDVMQQLGRGDFRAFVRNIDNNPVIKIPYIGACK